MSSLFCKCVQSGDVSRSLCQGRYVEAWFRPVALSLRGSRELTMNCGIN
jgi:hypothetical protein